MESVSLLASSLLIFALAINPAWSKLVLEEGYTVSTAVDFNKFSSAPASGVYPHAVAPVHSSQDLVLLDSTGSTFYRLSFPASGNQEAEISHLSGNGKGGFLDGDAKVASFNKPRNFAVDGAGNVYVADRINHVIRKIDRSGFTTTIAGGYSQKPGNADGPAQNASFSNDFELVYMHKTCSLLIVDRANRLIRQINLPSKDCAHKAPKTGLGATLATVIAFASLLLGTILGFVARPFLNFHGPLADSRRSMIWKQYLTSPGRATQMSFSGITSAVANTTAYNLIVKLIKYSICYFSVIVRTFRPKIIVASSPMESGYGSLMDLNVEPVPTFCEKNDSLKDLMCLGTGNIVSVCKREEAIYACVESSGSGKNRLDEMILNQLSDFSGQAKEQGVLEVSHMSGSVLVRRRTAAET